MTFTVFYTFPERGWLGWNQWHQYTGTLDTAEQAEAAFKDWAATAFASTAGLHYVICNAARECAL